MYFKQPMDAANHTEKPAASNEMRSHALSRTWLYFASRNFSMMSPFFNFFAA